jgi:hypothetical protein
MRDRPLSKVADCSFCSEESRRYPRPDGNHYVIEETSAPPQPRFHNSEQGLRAPIGGINEIREPMMPCHDAEVWIPLSTRVYAGSAFFRYWGRASVAKLNSDFDARSGCIRPYRLLWQLSDAFGPRGPISDRATLRLLVGVTAAVNGPPGVAGAPVTGVAAATGARQGRLLGGGGPGGHTAIHRHRGRAGHADDSGPSAAAQTDEVRPSPDSASIPVRRLAGS